MFIEPCNKSIVAHGKGGDVLSPPLAQLLGPLRLGSPPFYAMAAYEVPHALSLILVAGKWFEIARFDKFNVPQGALLATEPVSWVVYGRSADLA